MSPDVLELVLGFLLAFGVVGIFGHWAERGGLFAALASAVSAWAAKQDAEHRKVELWAEGFAEGQEFEKQRHSGDSSTEPTR